jgi:predicted nucleotidyltransferase
MRLQPEQARIIVRCVTERFGPDASVSVFGSMLDDAARGGDIDLLVESSDQPTLRQRAGLVMALEGQLGRPVDVLAVRRGAEGSPFVRLARRRGQILAGVA